VRFPGLPTVPCSIAAEGAVAPAEQTSNRYATPEQENFLNEINAAGAERPPALLHPQVNSAVAKFRSGKICRRKCGLGSVAPQAADGSHGLKLEFVNQCGP
jgi:hypothetical protein